MTGHEAVRMSLGAYALATLEPADQHRVEAHLAECASCRRELAELESVVPALAALTRDDLVAPAPSADLFDRIACAVDACAVDAAHAPGVEGPASVSSIRAERARRPARRWLLAAAAAVVVLAGGGAAIGVAISSSSSSSTSVASGTNGALHLRVEATDTGSRTHLELTAKGLPAHEHCHLVALAADGSRHDAGSWDASYEGQASVSESTDVARSQLRRLSLYGSDGDLLVAVDL